MIAANYNRTRGIKDTFDVNEAIPVHIKSNGKRRIIIPQMKFHTSESDSENKKETCGIYLCNTIDGIYNNIKFEDHSFFIPANKCRCIKSLC